MDTLNPCRNHQESSTQSSSPLQPFAYHLSDLVNATIRDGLSAARSMDGDQLKDTLRYHLIEGIHDLYYHGDDYKHLLSCAKYLDHCFFFGALTYQSSSAGAGTGPHLEIIVKPYACDGLSDSTMDKPQDEGQTPVVQIVLEPFICGRCSTFSEMVERLVHEMVHAYLMIFLCDGRRYCTNRAWRNGFRRSRHGTQFQKLLTHIFVSIQEWDWALDGFGQGYLDDPEECF